MKKLWAMGILVGLVALTVTSCATAKDMKGKFGIGGNIGYALMDIKGVNEWLDVCEEGLRQLALIGQQLQKII